MSFDKTNLRRRITHSLGANVSNQAVTVVIQLVGVPVLLRAWGTQLYGEWLLLFAIPAYLSMTDLGFSQSAGNDMTARVGRDDYPGALAVFQTLGALVLTVSAVGMVLSASLLSYLPLRDLLDVTSMSPETVRWVLWLLGTEVLVYLSEGVISAGFRASGDVALYTMAASTVRLIQFSAVWIAALSGHGPVAAAAAFLGARVVATPTLAVLLARRHRWLRVGLHHARRSELRRLCRPALANLALPLALALNVQGMLVVVGATLGPVAVVIFSTSRTLTRLALQVIQVVGLSAEPELAAAHGANDRALMRYLFMNMLRSGLWLALAAAAGLVMFGPHLLRAWTQGRVPLEPALFAWLLVSAVASVLWSGALSVLKAANSHLGAAAVFVVSSATSVAVAWFLLRWTGNLANAGLALVLADAAMSLFTLGAATRLLQVSGVRWLAQALDPRYLPSLVLRRTPARAS